MKNYLPKIVEILDISCHLIASVLWRLKLLTTEWSVLWNRWSCRLWHGQHSWGEIWKHAVGVNKLPSWTKNPLSGSIVQNSDVANAAGVGGGTCRCLAALWTFYALLGVIIFCEGVLWALLALGTGAFPRPCCSQEWCCLMWIASGERSQLWERRVWFFGSRLRVKP